MGLFKKLSRWKRISRLRANILTLRTIRILNAHHDDADKGVIGWKVNNRNIGVKADGTVRETRSPTMFNVQKKVFTEEHDPNKQA